MIAAALSLIGGRPWLVKGGLALALLAAAGVYHWNAKRVAFDAGRAAERQAAVIAAGKRIKAMEMHNDQFRNLSARERCLAFMRDSGLPGKHCD